jgi:hypothetical protein
VRVHLGDGRPEARPQPAALGRSLHLPGEVRDQRRDGRGDVILSPSAPVKIRTTLWITTLSTKRNDTSMKTTAMTEMAQALMVELTPLELPSLMTFIRDFMCENSNDLKTLDQLASIFVACIGSGWVNNPANDLRIADYEDEMNAGRWSEPVVLERSAGLITDGIHRGVAFTLCLREPTSVLALPSVYLVDVP